MSDHQPKAPELVVEEEENKELDAEEEEEPKADEKPAEKEKPKADEKPAEKEAPVLKRKADDEEEKEELEADETEPEPKRQKAAFDPNDFESITDAVNSLANSDVLVELSRPDFMTRFAARHRAHSTELHAAVYNTAAAMMDSAVLMMQMSELMLATRWIRSSKPVANFLPRDNYHICNNSSKALERGVALLLIGLAAHRNPEKGFEIHPDATVPLDIELLDVLVKKTSVECLLYFWEKVGNDFQSRIYKHRIDEKNRASEFCEFLRHKLDDDNIGFEVKSKSRGYNDLARVRRVLDVLYSKHPMPTYGKLMGRPL